MRTNLSCLKDLGLAHLKTDTMPNLHILYRSESESIIQNGGYYGERRGIEKRKLNENDDSKLHKNYLNEPRS